MLLKCFGSDPIQNTKQEKRRKKFLYAYILLFINTVVQWEALTTNMKILANTGYQRMVVTLIFMMNGCHLSFVSFNLSRKEFT